MEENNSLERVNRSALDTPYAVPATAYPTDVVSADPESRPLLEYWRIMLKRRWTIIGVMLLVIFTVMVWTLKQRPVYRSTTVIQIDRDSPNILSFQGFVAEMNPYDNSYLETAYEVLGSRSLAYRVIRKLNLDQTDDIAGEKPTEPGWFSSLWPGKKDATQSQPSPEEQLDPKYSAAISSFLGRLLVTPVRRSQLVEISYESFDAARSARVANTIAANYIDMNLEAKWDATRKASDWLSQQLVEMKGKLEKSEEDLQRYAKDNSILFVDEKQSMNSQKLEQLQAEETRAQSDLIQKESLYNQLAGGNYTSVPGMYENKVYQDLSLKLADLKQQYSELSSTFTPEYPRVKRLKGQIDEVTASLERERKAFVQRVEDEYKAAKNRNRLLEQAIAQQTKDFNQIAEKSIQYNILKREADTNRQLYDGLLQRLKEAGVSAGMRASNVRVVDPAEIPRAPAKPRKTLNLALSIILGMGLGLGLAFFQEYMDNTLKTPEDVQKYLQLPTLGVIPSTNLAKKKLGYGTSYGSSAPKALAGQSSATTSALQLIGTNGNSAIAEAYRSLRTSVLLSSSGQPPRAILVTSAHPGEGKTTTAVNLAISLVQLGQRVLIVDSDMRRPRVGTLLKLPPTPTGLSTYLTGQYKLEEVAQPTSIPDLYAITCGPIPPNPAELLSSSLMSQFIAEALTKFDYVILDSPPVLHVADSRILGAQVEAAVLVTHGNVTPRESVQHAKAQLQRVNTNIIGVLLNNVDFGAGGYNQYYRYYGGGYGYESHDQSADSANAA